MYSPVVPTLLLVVQPVLVPVKKADSVKMLSRAVPEMVLLYDHTGAVLPVKALSATTWLLL